MLLTMGIVLSLSYICFFGPRLDYKAMKRGNGEDYIYTLPEKIFGFFFVLIIIPTGLGMSAIGAVSLVPMIGEDLAYIVGTIFLVLVVLLFVKLTKMMAREYIDKKSKAENFTYNRKKFFGDM